jgi:hypothetical protein
MIKIKRQQWQRIAIWLSNPLSSLLLSERASFLRLAERHLFFITRRLIWRASIGVVVISSLRLLRQLERVPDWEKAREMTNYFGGAFIPIFWKQCWYDTPGSILWHALQGLLPLDEMTNYRWMRVWLKQQW